MPFVTSGFLFLVVMPGAPSSDALVTRHFFGGLSVHSSELSQEALTGLKLQRLFVLWEIFGFCSSKFTLQLSLVSTKPASFAERLSFG